MAQYAVINGGVVENLISSTSDLAEASWVLVPSGITTPDGRDEVVSVGDLYDASTQAFSKRGATAEENENQAKRLLQESDWTQLSDVGLTNVCKDAFNSYRETLRAIAVTPTDGDKDWPTKPDTEYA